MPYGWHIPTIRHNEIRNLTASLVTEVCHNVAIEPLLQPLSGELFSHRSANTQPNTHQDICVRGFWSAGQDAIFDIRVFHPNASSNHSKITAAAYRKHETAKKREYAKRIREVENSLFHPTRFLNHACVCMCVHVRACMRAYECVPECVFVYTHTQAHTHARTSMNTHTQALTDSRTHTYTRTNTPTQTLSRKNTHTRTHTRKYTHTHKHTCKHTQKEAQTRTN